MDKERRKTNPVHDKELTISLNLNNILTALLLASIIWGGRSVIEYMQSMNETLIELKQTQQLIIYRVNRLERLQGDG